MSGLLSEENCDTLGPQSVLDYYFAVCCRLGMAQLGQHAEQSVSTIVETEGVGLQSFQ